MPLISTMLRNNFQLQSCLTSDAAHLVEGAVGPHVGLLQAALYFLDGLSVARGEERSQTYGPTTAASVLDFKTRRRIINTTYQSQPDNIVGKMTISALDRELLQKEGRRATIQPAFCGNDPRSVGPAGAVAAGLPTFTRASFISAPGLAAPRAALVSAGGGLSAANVAKQRAPGAITAVTRTQAKLGTLISDRARPSVPTNPVALNVADALWRNFGLPIFPKNSPLLPNATNSAVKNLDDYLAVVAAVLQGIVQNLGQAGTLFRDPPRPQHVGAHAFTLSLSRDPSDPPDRTLFPDGIYFNPRFLSNGGTPVGPTKQTEVVIHECGHFVQNDNIGDSATGSLSSAHGYSNFVLQCAFGTEAISDTQ